MATNLFGVLIGIIALGIVALVSAPLWAVALLVVLAAFTTAQPGRVAALARPPEASSVS